jgi:hypothetical protein
MFPLREQMSQAVRLSLALTAAIGVMWGIWLGHASYQTPLARFATTGALSCSIQPSLPLRTAQELG